MSRLMLSVFTLLVLLSSLAGTAQIRLEGPGEPPVALVYVALPEQGDLNRFVATGLPAYAHLYGRQGGYLLTGGGPADRETLAATGLSFHVLDADTAEATYYLVYRVPNRPSPDWSIYGRPLLDDGVQVLLSTPPERIDRLFQAGIKARRLTLEPMPLRPARPSDWVAPTLVDPDPQVQLIMDQVISSTVYSYTGGLSGEWPVVIGGEPYTIATRHTYSGEPIRQATRFVGDHLAALGLDVEYHNWGGVNYPNVIGELPGEVTPEDIFIVCAHLDSMPSGPRAPGADDDASGSTGVLIAADILTQYHWGCTLRFVLFTGEEQWMLGSYAYAERCYNRGENLVGVLNLDMIGWNTPMSSRDMDMEAEPSVPGSVEIAELFSDVVSTYDLDLIPAIRYGGAGDHIAFWEYGYPAILAIEDLEDFNPRYHTPDERLQYLDIDYFTEMVKAGLATFVHMAGCLIPSGTGHLDGHVTTLGSGAPIQGATVTIYDRAGHAFLTSTNAAGYYTHTLETGVYTVTAAAYGHLSATVTGVVVLSDSVTTQDFALQLAPTHTISGTVVEVGTGEPLAAQVSFLGSPVVVDTDPTTGYYWATVAEGSYTMQVRADRHRTVERAIVADHDQTQDFALERLPCVLLVDDDIDGPDVRAYYTSTLDALQLSYDVWNLNLLGDPAVEDLMDYRVLIWFTGQPWNTTLSSDNEATLAAYLEDGGNLFLSSEDYLYDAGLTTFGQSYLGIDDFTDNVNRIDPVGNAGHPVGDGLGPYSLVLPPGWDSFRTDRVNGVQSSPFHWQATGQNNSTSYEGGHFRSVFLAWPLEGLADVEDRAEVCWAAMDWFGGCSEEGWLTGQVVDAVSGEPLVEADVRVGVFQAATDSVGHYTFTLPAGSYDVTAAMDGYVSRTITGVIVQAGLTTTQDLALAPLSVCVPVHGAGFGWSPTSPIVGQVVTLTGDATGTLPITYSWKLEVGRLGEGQVVTHVYSLPGVYSVVMTATNCQTATAAAVHTITVTCDEVEIVTVTQGISGCVVTFGAELTGTSPLTFSWDFGPFGVSTETNPVVDFRATGVYTGTLAGWNCGGIGYDFLPFSVKVACSPPDWEVYLPLVVRGD